MANARRQVPPLLNKRAAAHMTSPRRLATASAVGTTLEWYDFTVYNTLADDSHLLE